MKKAERDDQALILIVAASLMLAAIRTAIVGAVDMAPVFARAAFFLRRLIFLGIRHEYSLLPKGK
ncbi:hypothetical protein FHR23_001116 [Stakelama sediminis]|uniref:Uncharacterized protein n=1 Tax=Stakelama sediminis TaxID=463200 RepID=A0A840YXD2_9SPHN|nr:hypothetical protein [Stakelama sediminis]MBB5718209.1 hypothetical protein [Stakelama sediminis]